MAATVVSYISDQVDPKDIPPGARMTEVDEDLNTTKGRAQLAVDHLLSDYTRMSAKSPEDHLSEADRRVVDAEAELERARDHQKTVKERTKDSKNGSTGHGSNSGSTNGPKGALPDDFPGKTALDEAGITTYTKVSKLSESGELTTVPGIGQSTAEKIDERLGKDAKAT